MVETGKDKKEAYLSLSFWAGSIEISKNKIITYFENKVGYVVL